MIYRWAQHVVTDGRRGVHTYLHATLQGMHPLHLDQSIPMRVVV